MEVVVSTVLIAIAIAAFLPIVFQTTQLYLAGQKQEELVRQESVFEETIFLELRYGKNFLYDNNTIRFNSSTGHDTGFTVQNGILYRILDNGEKQPMNGNGLHEMDEIKIMPMGDTPYFSCENGLYIVQMVLVNIRTNKKWPCLIYVVPFEKE